MNLEPNNTKSKLRSLLYVGIAAVLATVLADILFIPKTIHYQRTNGGNTKIDEVQQLIETYYFDEVSTQKLTDDAIVAMLQNLDPHSSYMNREETEQANSVMQGGFEGIGVQFNLLNDTLLVIAVTTGGPSEKAGIMAGDRILRVDGENIAGVHIANADILKKLRGKKNTKVHIEILRQGQKDLIPFDIVRDKIAVNSISIAYEIAPKTGYILLDNFSFTTKDEFNEALKNLIDRGMTKLILDLRGNPGGHLDAAISVCNQLIARNKLLVYTYGKSVGKHNYYANSSGLFKQKEQKLVVLIDEYSASASEIVAGAVQDLDRGTIIGRRSFGKGLVQSQFFLSDSSEVLITIARYYTPSGRCIQRPFELSKNDAYYMDIIDRYMHGEMENKDSIKFADSLKFSTENGRTVYGGGGIMPDIFIPIRISDSLKYSNALMNNGIILNYAMDYVDKNRQKLNASYKNAEDFVKRFPVTETMMQEIIQRGETAGIAPNVTAFTRRELRKWAKAFIGRNLFGERAFYPVLNQEDEAVKKAMEVLK